jgi:hypothetical protein
MGFVKAYDLAPITQLTKEISKSSGIVWLTTAVLFAISAAMFLLKKDGWPLFATLAVIISQVLIILIWKDAKFGTIANAIILLVAILGWTNRNFESRFEGDVKLNLLRLGSAKADVITQDDIAALPEPVQKYLHYTGVVNTPKVRNAKIVFDGEMRDKGKDWFRFRSVQYNFFDDPTRLFFMKAHMYGVAVPGYHRYIAATARMDIRLFGLFPVVVAEGLEMNKAETVTVFNDMCTLVPASLIDKRIQWEPIDSTSAKATFANGTNKISAILYFNGVGQLVNFVSDDRYAIGDMKQYRFSTPMRDYKPMGKINVPFYGEAIWHYPEGEFVYGKFHLVSIEYNVD